MLRSNLKKKITRTRLKEFLRRHRTERKVLDVGCSVAAYKELFPNSLGVDIDSSKKPDIVGDIHALPCDDDTFEVVLCTEVLEHVHSPHLAVEEMRRVLKPGGTLILSTRFVFPLHDAPYDYYRYTPYGLRHLFREWEIVELIPETNTMETFAVLLQTLEWKTTLRGGFATRGMLLILAKVMRLCSWFIVEERTSGAHGVKMTTDHIMSSGYYLVCKNNK